MMDLALAGKVALVTGGSRGIGKAICMSLAAEGASVGVNCRQQMALAEAVADKIRETHGVGAAALQADLSVPGEVPAMFNRAETMLGPVDILVNNAAHCPTGAITDFTREAWEYTFAVNVTGAFVACRELVRRLLAGSRTGRIVNVVSQAAFRGSRSGHLPYDSSKGAMVSFTVALAREVAGRGIGVNAVAPGMVLTEMVREKWEARKDEYLARIPLRRIADPAEIARVVTFLASDGASYMTGATVDVSGGLAMR
jgi:3-oxoacyl-[acyl-carrier protein] reductase